MPMETMVSGVLKTRGMYTQIKAPDLHVMATFTLEMSRNDHTESTEEADTLGHQLVANTKSN